MIKKSLEKALFEMDPEIVDEVAEDLCEKRLEKEAKMKTINFRKRIVLIAAAAALVIAAVMIPLTVMMNKAPDPTTDPPVATNTAESKTEKQTTPTDAQQTTPTEVQQTTSTNVDPTKPTDDPITPSDPTIPSDTTRPTDVDPSLKVGLLDLSGSVITESGLRDYPSESQRGVEGEPLGGKFNAKRSSFTIIAKIVDILPDEYREPGYSYQFRLCRLEVLNTVYGERLPEEIYLALPVYCIDEALLGYDCFALSVFQHTIDGARAVNVTKMTFESLPACFRTVNFLNPQNGDVIAFTDGKIDRSLWELPGWQGILTYRHGMMEFDELCSNLFSYRFRDGSTGKIDSEGYHAYMDAGIFSLEDVVAALENKTAGYGDGVSYVTAADFADNETLRYVNDSGAFFCVYDPETGKMTCTRIVDGYMTTERYVFDKNGMVSAHGGAFTEDDLRAMPDLAELAAQFDPERPLVHVLENWTIRARNANIACWYAKTEEGVYGVARMIVNFSTEYGRCHDDFYLLCDNTGVYREVTREELAAVVGDDYIARFNYFEPDPEV